MNTNKFTRDEILKGIDYVFNELWPRMSYNRKHYEKCQIYVGTITALFNNVDSINTLLQSLATLPGISFTISSGIMYSIYRDKYVPFDKYTIEHAYKLRIIPDRHIDDHYEEYCNKIVEYINNSKSLDSIEDFVRESWEF